MKLSFRKTILIIFFLTVFMSCQKKDDKIEQNFVRNIKRPSPENNFAQNEPFDDAYFIEAVYLNGDAVKTAAGLVILTKDSKGKYTQYAKGTKSVLKKPLPAGDKIEITSERATEGLELKISGPQGIFLLRGGEEKLIFPIPAPGENFYSSGQGSIVHLHNAKKQSTIQSSNGKMTVSAATEGTVYEIESHKEGIVLRVLEGRMALRRENGAENKVAAGEQALIRNDQSIELEELDQKEKKRLNQKTILMQKSFTEEYQDLLRIKMPDGSIKEYSKQGFSNIEYAEVSYSFTDRAEEADFMQKAREKGLINLQGVHDYWKAAAALTKLLKDYPDHESRKEWLKDALNFWQEALKRTTALDNLFRQQLFAEYSRFLLDIKQDYSKAERFLKEKYDSIKSFYCGLLLLEVYHAQKKTDEYITLAAELKNKNNKNASELAAQGAYFSRNSQWEEAILAYNLAIEKTHINNPLESKQIKRRWEWIYQIAVAYYNAGKYKEAVYYAEKGMNHFKQDAMALY